jgi:hypothetical protein
VGSLLGVLAAPGPRVFPRGPAPCSEETDRAARVSGGRAVTDARSQCMDVACMYGPEETDSPGRGWAAVLPTAGTHCGAAA